MTEIILAAPWVATPLTLPALKGECSYRISLLYHVGAKSQYLLIAILELLFKYLKGADILFAVKEIT